MKHYNLILLFLTLLFFIGCQSGNTNTQTQANSSGNTYSIAFYNLENLFDTERDTSINDVEFTPESVKQWTKDKYEKKLNNLSYVISQLAKEECPDGPAIIGVAEVENKRVLQDLTSNPNIAARNYKIVHHDSPDPRGIDVALIYNPVLFEVISSKVYGFKYPQNTNYKTRDILLVSGKLNNEPFHVLVNHWPSRRGENSAELRDYSAQLCKSISDSIYKADKNAKIVIMGDLNDNPADRSCRVILNAKRNQDEVKEGGLFNTMWNLHESGQGTACYRNNWDLFDQIIISESLINKNTQGLKFHKAEIFNKDFLIQQSGQYKGYPLRSFSGNTFLNGYSDHFPTIIYLK